MAHVHVFKRRVKVDNDRGAAARRNVTAGRPTPATARPPSRQQPPLLANITPAAPVPRKRTPFPARPDAPSQIRTRFLRESGTRAVLRVYWGEDCPNSYGRGGVGTHNAKVHLIDSELLDQHELGGKPEDYGEDRWPSKCNHCDSVPPPVGATAPCSCGCGAIREIATRQVFQSRLYRAPDNVTVDEHDMVPGDMYLETWSHGDDGKCRYWDNCTTPHLHVILPDGFPWDTSSRASNCTLKDDRTHRCWVVHGDPTKGDLVTVDKAGPTCAAGAGSILSCGYHGHLVAGILRKC